MLSRYARSVNGLVLTLMLALTLGGNAAWAGQGYLGEVEPNDTSGTATPLGGTNVVARGNVYPNGDVDWYSFTAAAGDRLYAAVMTNFSANASTDSQLRVLHARRHHADRVRR